MNSFTYERHRERVTAPTFGAVIVGIGIVLILAGYFVYGASGGGGQAIIFYGFAVLSIGFASVFFGLPQALFAAGGGRACHHSVGPRSDFGGRLRVVGARCPVG